MQQSKLTDLTTNRAHSAVVQSSPKQLIWSVPLFRVFVAGLNFSSGQSVYVGCAEDKVAL